MSKSLRVIRRKDRMRKSRFAPQLNRLFTLFFIYFLVYLNPSILFGLSIPGFVKSVQKEPIKNWNFFGKNQDFEGAFIRIIRMGSAYNPVYKENEIVALKREISKAIRRGVLESSELKNVDKNFDVSFRDLEKIQIREADALLMNFTFKLSDEERVQSKLFFKGPDNISYYATWEANPLQSTTIKKLVLNYIELEKLD